MKVGVGHGVFGGCRVRGTADARWMGRSWRPE